MNCGGSVRLSRDAEPEPESIYAREGTIAHGLGELALTKQADPDFWVGMDIDGWPITEDMADHVRTYTEFCTSLIKGRDSLHWIERRIDLAPLDPPDPMRGTSDFIAYHVELAPERRGILDVVDLKFGKSIVEVEWNPQELYYAIGAVLSIQAEYKLPIDVIRITIVQPRAEHAKGPIRTFEITIEDLLEWAEKLVAAARLALTPDAPLVPGEWCRWCKAQGKCPALANFALAEAQAAFAAAEMPTAPPVDTLTTAQLRRVLDVAPVIESFIKAAAGEMQRRVESGEDNTGYKLVDKRATRKWTETAYEQLKERGLPDVQLLEPGELRSPAQLEKLVGKKRFKEVASDLCPSISSGVTLARLDDSRNAVQIESGFDALP